MAADSVGLKDLVRKCGLVAVHIGFGSDRVVKSGQIRSFDFDTSTLTLETTDGFYVIPLSSISAMRVLEPPAAVHLVKG